MELFSGEEKLVKGGGEDSVGGEEDVEEDVVVVAAVDLEKFGGGTGFKLERARDMLVSIGLSSLEVSEDFGVSSSVLFC